VQQRFEGVNGETLPDTQIPNRLQVEHLLQRFRDVWVAIETYPFLAVDTERLFSHCLGIGEFVVFANGCLLQNMRRDEAGRRLLNVFASASIDAGVSPDAKIIVEGMANPRAHWMIYFNDPFYVGMYPFAALGTRYIYIDENGIYQRTFAELVIVDGYSRPRSTHVDFDPLADLVRTFQVEYINGPMDVSRDMGRLTALLDAIFIENGKIHAVAAQHHREHAPLEKPFDYIAPTLTRYGRLTHNDTGQPRIELSFALLHYEKALRELHDLKAAVHKNNTEGAFFHGVYCVVAVAACAEAIGNRLVFQEKKIHPDHRDKRTPVQKMNEAAAALAQALGRRFVPLTAGQSHYDALEKARELRNAFMHAKERDEEVDQVALTSIVFTAVDEIRCRGYLRNLRLAVAQIYDQLAPDHAPPIVTRENVKWLGDLEMP
jgi:hypothetical protein